MKEKIIAVVAGVVVAILIVVIMEAITGAIFPMPEGTDVASYVSNASVGMFILLTDVTHYYLSARRFRDPSLLSYLPIKLLQQCCFITKNTV